ncbi:hypothetical protein L7F22_004800 [Adiantum nelumboides]|nr:hypothetical protein [Adiantum nelumboides]
MSIDGFDFAHEGATNDTPMLVNYLVTRLQKAMGNPTLQSKVQQKLHAHGILPPPKEESNPKKSHGDTFERGLSTLRKVENPYEGLWLLLEDEENKIEDEGDMSQATQQVLPTIDEETPFHKGDAMSTQEVVEHESDFVAQKPSNDMNKGSENMLPTIGETQIHEGNTRNSEEKMVVVENQSDVQTSPKPSDDMIIKDTYNMPLRDEEVEGSEKKDEANEEHQGALATTEVQDKVDKGTGKATRNANKAQSIQKRVQGTEGGTSCAYLDCVYPATGVNSNARNDANEHSIATEEKRALVSLHEVNYANAWKKAWKWQIKKAKRLKREKIEYEKRLEHFNMRRRKIQEYFSYEHPSGDVIFAEWYPPPEPIWVPKLLVDEKRALILNLNGTLVTTVNTRFGDNPHAYAGDLQLQQAARDSLVEGLPTVRSPTGVCEPCQLGKQHRVAFPKQASTRASAPLALVHTDLCGPVSTSSLSGLCYMLVLVDDFSRYTWVSFLKLKSEAFGSIRDWKAMVKKEKDLKVKSICFDRGGEFLSENFARWCKSEGIRRQLTTPYNPSQNGVVERKKRTIMEMARAMLAHASLPRSY